MEQIGRPVFIVDQDGKLAIGEGGTVVFEEEGPDGALPLRGYAPAISLRDLGDRSFCRDLGIRYPYIAGAMANGIASATMVEAMANAGMLGFFGAAGLSLQEVEKNIVRISQNVGTKPFGSNLIHSPNEQDLESAIVDLYLKHDVRLVSASAYLGLTPHVVRYRLHGIHRDRQGRVVTPNRVVAKVSRVEVATRFFSPAPDAILRELVHQGHLAPEQAELARRVPVAQELTAEADSGGHTDNRPAVSLLPTMLALRDRLQQQFEYDVPLRVGAAGGVATPASAAAAFAMGAAYILTGSVNQSCVESGTSDAVRKMLAEAEQADTAMAPAADMFEMGVKVQVLKRGTMFAMRAAKLYELYRNYASLDEIPAAERTMLEKNLFRAPLTEIWKRTEEFFQQRDPTQIEKARKDPKHQMALVFRWYLGLSSRWANAGDPTRILDYQVWCGPAMGAFNEWVRGSFLEAPENRKVVTVAMNILYGAAVLTRLHILRSQGVPVPTTLWRIAPLELEDVEQRIRAQGLKV